MKSGSQELHEHMENWIIGAEFTCHDLMRETNLNQGIVTGFLARAQKTGMVEPVMRQKIKGQRGRTLYRLVSHVEWKHKPKSKGSAKGRHMHKTDHQGILPLSDNVIEVEHNSPVHTPAVKLDVADYVNKIALNNGMIPADVVGHITGLPKTPAGDMWPTPLSDLPSTSPIWSRLVDIATEVEALENKSLKDYSTDDLINEIKRRMK